MTNKNIVSTHKVVLGNEEVEVYRIKLDSNGNPRYVVHFLSLGVESADYGKIEGLTVYRAKWFGGGYVFQSYNIQEDLQRAYELVQAHYEKLAGTNAPKYYGTDLHRKGEMKAMAKMERLAKRIERESLGGLAGAYLTNGFYGADCIGIIANNPSYQYKQGNVVYDIALDKAVFIQDSKDM